MKLAREAPGTGTGKTVLWTMDGATKTASAYTSASAGTAWVVQ